MAEWGDRRPVTVSALESVRARLRSSSSVARSEAVIQLRAWQGAALGSISGPAVLRAATVGYPWVAEIPDDVGELLVQLLWEDPFVVDVAALEQAYPFCAERARRAILRTLALRADTEALDAVEHLLGFDGPWDLLPLPTADLLHPLLVVPGVARLAPTLATVAWRRGWAGHAADMLLEMASRGLMDAPASDGVVEAMTPLVFGLVDTCDRGSGAKDRDALVRVDRQRLAALTPLFAELPGESASDVLRRVLACADPRVAAIAVVALAKRGETVGEDRLELVARDPEARALLFAGLVPMGRGFELPAKLRSEVAVAEAEVVAWLASATQLRAAPDEVEHRGSLSAPQLWGHGVLHLFAFRVRPPHWSASRGWMLAAVGPFDPDARLLPRRAEGFAVHSLYESQDGDEVGRHVLAIAEAVVQARGEEAA